MLNEGTAWYLKDLKNIMCRARFAKSTPFPNLIGNLMRTHFHGHRFIKHLFALILITGSRCRQRSRSIILQFTTFHF